MCYNFVKKFCRFLLLAGVSCDSLVWCCFAVVSLRVGRKTVRCVVLLACPRQRFAFLWCGGRVGTCLMGM
jgi:hypothetical protein